jgi:VWFA-related protein
VRGQLRISFELSLLGTLLLAGVAGHSQQATFRARVDLVQLDVSVLRKDGQPVRGLEASDFTVLEDGKPQPIVALSEIDNAVSGRAVDTPLDGSGVATNAVDGHRLFLIVLDDATMRCDLPGARPGSNGALPQCMKSTKDIAHEVVASMSPGDLAAVVFTADNRRAQNWTTDRAKLLAAIDLFEPGFAGMTDRPPTPGVRPAAAKDLAPPPMDQLYDQMLLSTLTSAAVLLRDTPDRRKTIVYIGTGVRFDPDDLQGRNLGADVPVRVAAERVNDALNQLFAEAERTNISIYTFDAFGLRPGDADTLGTQFQQILASNTGGEATVHTNDFTPGVERMFTENSSYYLVGYRSSRGNDDGSIRRIEVKVDRPDVEVRAPRQHFAAKASADSEPTDLAALESVVPRHDLTLTATAAAFPARDRSSKTSPVAVVFGVTQPASDAHDDNLDVHVVAFDAEGRKERASSHQTVRAHVPASSSAGIRYEVASKLDLKPGRYVIRIAATNVALDKAGSVDVDVDVPDAAKAPLSLSDVILDTAPRVPSAPPGALAALVPVTPTVNRVFSTGMHVAAFVRLSERDRKVAGAVAIHARLLNERHEAVWNEERLMSADNFGASASADVRIDVPLAGLPSGAYALEIGASSEGATTQSRAVSFRVK